VRRLTNRAIGLPFLQVMPAALAAALAAVAGAVAAVAAAAADGKVRTPCLIIMLSSLKFLLTIRPILLLLHR
jgi:hypothetical protein